MFVTCYLYFPIVVQSKERVAVRFRHVGKAHPHTHVLDLECNGRSALSITSPGETHLQSPDVDIHSNYKKYQGSLGCNTT